MRRYVVSVAISRVVTEATVKGLHFLVALARGVVLFATSPMTSHPSALTDVPSRMANESAKLNVRHHAGLQTYELQTRVLRPTLDQLIS